MPEIEEPSFPQSVLQERVQSLRSKMSTKLQEKRLADNPTGRALDHGPPSESDCRECCKRLVRSLLPMSLLTSGNNVAADGDDFVFRVTPNGEMEIKGSPLDVFTRPLFSGVDRMLSSITSHLEADCVATCKDRDFGPLIFPPGARQCLSKAETSEDVRRCLPKLEEFMEAVTIAEEIRSLEKRIDEM